MCVFVVRVSEWDRNKRRKPRASTSVCTALQRLNRGSTRSTSSTHIVLQEVLDGSVHLGRDVGASDLTHRETEGQTDHCPHRCKQHITACNTLALSCRFDSQSLSGPGVRAGFQSLCRSDAAGQAKTSLNDDLTEWQSCASCPEVGSNCLTCHESFYL